MKVNRGRTYIHRKADAKSLMYGINCHCFSVLGFSKSFYLDLISGEEGDRVGTAINRMNFLDEFFI